MHISSHVIHTHVPTLLWHPSFSQPSTYFKPTEPPRCTSYLTHGYASHRSHAHGRLHAHSSHSTLPGAPLQDFNVCQGKRLCMQVVSPKRTWNYRAWASGWVPQLLSSVFVFVYFTAFLGWLARKECDCDWHTYQRQRARKKCCKYDIDQRKGLSVSGDDTFVRLHAVFEAGTKAAL